MSVCCHDEKRCADLARLEKQIQEHSREVAAALLTQDKKFSEFVCTFNGNLETAFAAYLETMEKDGKLADLITDTLMNGVFMLEKKTAHIINVKEFGAVGNGVCNDTEAIQAAIDYANKKGGRTVYIPRGRYLINRPLTLNGCSLIGEPGNVYGPNGTVIDCLTDDFTAIRQGSTATADIMFNLSDIVVNGANIGFEIVYSINSKFERLYATNCNTGFKIGDPSAVGCMFCEFNNLYTDTCKIAVMADSNQYFNNNRFNNGFLSGESYAMSLKVTGGYGAVGNVFNNVEFRSSTGRGIVLTSCVNTVFNSCYFECGGNVVRMTNTCSIALYDCTYGSHKAGNAYGDVNMIYAEGGGVITIDNGVVFLTSHYANRYFFGAANPEIYANITVKTGIKKNGTASGFNFFEKPVKELALKQDEQVALTGTVTVPAGETISVPYTFATPFASIPPVVAVTMRGAAGIEKGLHYCLSERLATGGKISLTNTTTGDRSVSFAVYAKLM